MSLYVYYGPICFFCERHKFGVKHKKQIAVCKIHANRQYKKALYFYASAMCPIHESGKDLNLEGETHKYVS